MHPELFWKAVTNHYWYLDCFSRMCHLFDTFLSQRLIYFKQDCLAKFSFNSARLIYMWGFFLIFTPISLIPAEPATNKADSIFETHK